MSTKYKILVTVAPAVFMLDQFTKLLIVATQDIGNRIPVIRGYFDIVHFRNEGAAFGMLAGAHDDFRAPFFFIVAIVAVVALAFFYRTLKDNEKLMPLAISLVFGGIAGNILDRIRLGSVVDFLSFHIGHGAWDFAIFGNQVHIPLEWPAFNVADSAITAAMILILYSTFFHKRGA